MSPYERRASSTEVLSARHRSSVLLSKTLLA